MASCKHHQKTENVLLPRRFARDDVACLHVSIHSSSRAAVGLGVILHIFDVGKMVLVQVEVQRTWVAAKRAMN